MDGRKDGGIDPINMDMKEIPRAIWGRKILLLIVVVVTALAALPFALASESTYSAKGEVLVPSLAPLPRIPQVMSASLIAARLDPYLDQGLQKDVRETLGEGPAVDVSAIQSLETSLITITATSASEDRALGAARQAVETLLDSAEAIAGRIVTELTDRLNEHLQPIEEELSRVEDRNLRIDSRVARLRRETQSVTAQLNAARQGLVRAEAQDDSDATVRYRTEIEKLEKSLEDLEEDLEEAESKAASVDATLALLRTRREGLASLSQEATGLQLTLSTAQSVTERPETASSNDLQTIALTEALAIVVGSLVGAATIVLLERRRMKKAGI